MEYEIGQKVRIKPKDWFVEHEFRINPDYCDKETTITGCKSGWYSLDIEPIEMYYDSIIFDPIEQNEVYKVTEEDLKGQLKSFPIEVVQKMVERQVEQGNKADVTVFQKNKCIGRVFKGLEWVETDEGIDFWNDVIRYENFDVFFEKYPKSEPSETEDTSKVEEPKSKVDTHVYYRGVADRGKEIISELEKLGGTNDYGEYNGKNEDNLYFLDPISKQIRQIETDINLG